MAVCERCVSELRRFSRLSGPGYYACCNGCGYREGDRETAIDWPLFRRTCSRCGHYLLWFPPRASQKR